MGRGLLYCHIYASERTPLGTGGVGSGTDRDKGGWWLHESSALDSISMASDDLMSFGFPQRTMSSVGWLASPLSNSPLSRYLGLSFEHNHCLVHI